MSFELRYGQYIILQAQPYQCMHSVPALLTTTWLVTHQVHSTFRFEFARSMQTAVPYKFALQGGANIWSCDRVHAYTIAQPNGIDR